ncbi:MAG: putative toxin-antitoxin system toxin component, PIN family [Saprospiraceae bacterium]|nr:putative toxin-antitoxin system toxin component, PIN family [Saprospiraceae bacterium]
MKIVLDTNIFISAFVFRGKAAAVFDHCALREELFVSQWILDELAQKLRSKFNIKEGDVLEMLSLITEKSSLVQPHTPLPSACRDVDDNNILQLAESVQADFLITGDKDLLVLGTFSGTRIVTPAQFLDTLEPAGSGT